ncbi:MAG: PAS domain S-box protein [Anaerolineae bacterium]
MVKGNGASSGGRRIHPPWRVVVIYALLSGAWILLSDRLTAWLVRDAETLAWLQTYKGWGFVLATSVVLYILLQRRWRAFQMELARRRFLQAEQGKFLEAVEQAGDVIFITDRHGTIEYVNSAFEKITGYTREEALGQNPHILRSGLMPPEHYQRLWHTILSGATFRSLVINRRKDGQLFYYDQTISPLKDAEGHITHFISTGKDMTEQAKMVEELRQYQMIFEQAENVARMGSWYLDLERNVLRWSPGTYHLFGVVPGTPLTYELFLARVHPEDRERVDRAWKEALAGAPYDIEHRIVVNGDFKWVHEKAQVMYDDSGNPKWAIGVVQDISEQKRAEEAQMVLEAQLRQVQKLEAVGRLASGVAHDFNNTLTAMIGYAELAMRQVEPTSTIYADLDAIRKAGLRSASLTRQLLAFARQQPVEPVELDLNETITASLKMLGRLVGEDIQIVWKPGEDLWRVWMDPGQVDQILANLVVNARDAIADVGQIIIETHNVEFDEEYCRLHVGFMPGQYVSLQVSDTGHGMSKEVMERIFEPFFTTKEPGKGTGLGLSIVYGIVRQNNGFINVYSEPGRGTTFHIYLPRYLPEGHRTVEIRAEGVEVRGTATILLVEDEELIRGLVRRMLEELGYHVLVAASGQEALGVAEEYAGDIHLLLTDVVMPGMSGTEL